MLLPLQQNKRVIRDYEQRYAKNLNNLDQMDTFLETQLSMTKRHVSRP